MAEPAGQSYSNHVRRVPAPYSIAFLLVLIYMAWHVYTLAVGLRAGVGRAQPAMALVLATATLLGLWYARVFALTVQDRVIRLEMRLRLAEVLPIDLRPRAKELTLGQLCAMRFADDAELPELTRRVLTDNIADRKTIKQMVKNWQGDWLRV